MNRHSNVVQLGDLMVERGGSTDPSKYPETKFVLYSIPAFDAGEPELAFGSDIGSSKKNVAADDVLLSRIVPHIRRAWIVGDHKEPMIASSEWIVFRDRRVHSNYLRHFLTSDVFHRQFMMTVAGVGGSLLRARPSDVARISLTLPPLEEQRRIAAILDKTEALRQKRKRAIALLDSLTQSIFLEMFGSPVSNPYDWPVSELGDFCDSRLGKMLDQKKMEGLERFPYLANYNVRWGDFALNDVREMGFSPEEQVEFRLMDGDLLVCEGGEIGRSAIWREAFGRYYFQKALHRVRPDPCRATSAYLQWYFWFMAKGGGLTSHTATATIAHLTGQKLKKLRVPLPPIEMQHAFEILSERHRGLQRAHKMALVGNDALFTSLQHRAFSGQL